MDWMYGVVGRYQRQMMQWARLNDYFGDMAIDERFFDPEVEGRRASETRPPRSTAAARRSRTRTTNRCSLGPRVASPGNPEGSPYGRRARL